MRSSSKPVARSLAVCLSVLTGCGGDVEGKSSANQRTEDAGAGEPDAAGDREDGGAVDPGTGGRGVGGGRPATGGRQATGGAQQATGGAQQATGGVGGSPVPPADGGDAGSMECPIRVSGTSLALEDCRKCIPPQARCSGMLVPPDPAQGCINVISLASTLWCAWYADGAPVDRPSPMITCVTEGAPGRIVCGGGI